MGMWSSRRLQSILEATFGPPEGTAERDGGALDGISTRASAYQSRRDMGTGRDRIFLRNNA